MCEQLFGQEENAMYERSVKKQIRIKSIKRFIIFILLIITGVSTFITWVLNSRDEDTFNTSKTSVKCKAVHIDSGDTVWDIAREYKSSNTDMREAVYAILNVIVICSNVHIYSENYDFRNRC